MTDVIVPLRTDVNSDELTKSKAVQKGNGQEPLAEEMPESGSELLSDVRSLVKRFCVFSSEHCLTAVTLWAAHTHIIEHLYTTARLALLSPEAASGKTRVLEVLDTLVPGSLLSLSASPASIFRLLAQEQITLLFDEVDAIWSRRGKDDNHEDLRALLNAGYKRGSSIPRCVGPKHEVTRFNVYCAVALAGLGDLPETIMSRSIIIRMRRRSPSEKVEPYRARFNAPQGHDLRARLESWAIAEGEKAADYIPNMPEGIVDRPAELWEPLLIVADLAGGDWPKLSRDACLALCKDAESQKASLGVRLLGDIKILFDKLKTDQVTTADLITHLTTDGERDEPWLEADAPWGDLYGKPISTRLLASLLKRYEVGPKKVRVSDTKTLQGYKLEDLHDAWLRYLPPVVPGEAEQTEQKELAALDVPNVPDVPDNWPPERAFHQGLTEANDESALDDSERLREAEAEYQAAVKDQEDDTVSVLI